MYKSTNFLANHNKEEGTYEVGLVAVGCTKVLIS